MQIMTILLFSSQFGYLLFLSLVWLLWLGLPITVLNKSGGSGHSCVVSDLKEKAFSFSLLSMLAVGLWHIAFIILRYSPSISTLLWVFILNGYLILSNAFSASIDMVWFYSSFYLCSISCSLICGYWINLHSGNKSYLIMVYNLLNVLLNLVC